MSNSKTIAFQGEPGANSHLACREAYPDHEPLPCPTFEDAFAAVASGDAELGMIPIENSIAGRVADIHHLLPESGPAHRRRVVPAGAPSADGAEGRDARRHQDRSTATSMRSASAAAIIRKLGVKPIVAADTAGSAREVAERGDKTLRGARLAARGRDLRPRHPRRGHRGRDAQHHALRRAVARGATGPSADDGPVITTFVFRVRNVPAALYKALGGFATNGVNMTKLESYMVDGNFFATQFYADVEGHPDDRSLVLALEELAFFSKEMKILGVYPAHPFRRTFQESAD